MIQPISTISVCGAYKRNLNFKNSQETTTELQPTELAEKRDRAIIDYIETTNKTQKQNQLLTLISLGLLPLCFIPLFMLQKKGAKNKNKVDISKTFQSLKDDKTIPTLDSCKSINDKLRNFLQTQIDFANATPADISATGAKDPANRLILYGAPGSGKTFFAKIYAKTLDADYKEVLYSDFNSQWVGEGINNLKEIFENAIKDAKKEPNKKFVLAFNEIDTMIQPAEIMQRNYAAGGGGHNLSKLEERSTFLNYIDRISDETPNITIIGTTNISPKNKGLDGAALSRFKNVMEVPYPDKKCLLEALKSQILEFKDGQQFIDANNDKLEKLAKSMADKKSSFRDLNNIFDTSKNFYLNDYVKNKNAKYKFEYLEKAQKSINLTDGEIAGVANESKHN